MTDTTDVGDLLWTPHPNASTAMSDFRRFVNQRHGLDLPDYAELWSWSVAEPELFWAAIWSHFELDAISGYDKVLSTRQMPGATWFHGAHLNFASYLLSRGGADEIAIIGADETDTVVHITWGQLRDDVAHLSATLQDSGVRSGDLVVGYLPNIPEAITAFLAVASIGAIWSSVGQDYAAPAVVDRFAQLKPVALVAADGYRYGGKIHDRRVEIDEICASLPTITMTVLIGHAGLGALDRSGVVTWAAAVAPRPPVKAVAVPFDHPLWVLFSSGTTGQPKGLVHGHGGILVESLKQMHLHWGSGPGDIVFWYTSPSWVMWNLLVSNLATGAAVVCFDGAPTWPSLMSMWQMVERLGVTFFGASPGFLQATQRSGGSPREMFDLSALRAMGSTGAPLAPDVHRWARDHTADVPLWSMSGGTDVAGAFAGGSPDTPVWAGELSAPCLAVAIEAWDESGQPVPAGAVGELVITRPMPSMPVRLWADPTGSRYRETYFDVFPNAWRQGDWITVTTRGSVVVHGRSDSTLNRNGVRMGSADIYAAVDTIARVLDSLVLGVEMPDGSYWMPLFVVVGVDDEVDDVLVGEIQAAIRAHASARHVPDEIIAVPGIPRTRTGKRLEVPLKRIMQGTLPDGALTTGAIDDPSLIDAFVEIAAGRAL